MSRPYATGDSVDPLFVKSLGKAFSVIEYLVDSHEPASLAEIAKRCGVSRSAAQRVVHTLLSLGYLSQGRDRGYVPSLRLLTIAGRVLRQHPLSEIALPHMVRLASEIDESVHLSRLDGDEIVYLERLPRHEVRSLGVTVGSRRPAELTAAGRCMLAMRAAGPASDVCERIDDSPRHGEFERIRSRGWSYLSGAIHSTEAAVAAAIHDADGQPFAALSIPFSVNAYSEESAENTLVPALKDAAAAITIQLPGAN